MPARTQAALPAGEVAERAPADTPPCHVAIIMDGNGRWAAARGLPRVAGHRAGAQAVRRTVETAIRHGVGWITLYAFSSENWRRPAGEVLDLTGLLRHYLRNEVRELKGEGVHVLTAYPAGTDTPMMKSNRAGPELGFGREPASAVAEAIVAAIRADAFEVVRGGEARDQMVALNREDPAAVDQRFLSIKPALAEAVRDHSAL